MSDLTETKLPVSPYKGLVPFSEEDARFFFGRDREIKIISANLRTQRLTLLYGPTGVGKTSVLKAGVLPNIQELNKQLEPLYLDLTSEAKEFDGINLSNEKAANERREPDERRSLVTVVVFNKWLGNPLISLKDTIIKGIRASLPNVFTLDKTYNYSALTLSELFKKTTSQREVLELLIILDQFEEYFVYHPAGPIADKFAEEFSRAVSDQTLRVNFLISIREDWIARLDRFKGRIPSLFDNSIRIDHLNHGSARDAIEKPVTKYNQIIRENVGKLESTRRQITLDPTFVPEALAQLEKLDGRGEIPRRENAASNETLHHEKRIQASHLQIVLLDLWQKIKNNSPPVLSMELLSKPDTAKRIIETNLRKTLARLGPLEKLLAADLFRFLVTPLNTKLAHTAPDLADRSNRNVKRIEPLLDKLSQPNFRILNRIGPSPGEPDEWRYELTSDALAGQIMDWTKDTLARKRRYQVQGVYILVSLVIIIILVFSILFLKSREKEQLANVRREAVEAESAKVQRVLDTIQRLDGQIPYSKAVLRAHGASVTSAVFAPKGEVLTASADGSAILWDVESKKPLQYFPMDEKGLITSVINPSGDRVVTASADGTVMVWAVGSDAKSELRPRGSPHITDIAFSPSGEIIAGVDTVGNVMIWNANPISVLKQMPGNGKPIRRLTFSESGKLLAVGSDDQTVRMWTTDNWSERNLLTGHTDRINSLAFSPDEKFLATASKDTTVRIWDLSTGLVSRVLRGHRQSINSVEFANDGKKLLTASDDTTARVWTLDSQDPIELIGHTDKVLSASLSPDAQKVVTAGKDGVVRIWSASRGHSLAELRGHIDEVSYVTYSGDGQYVLSAGIDATARVWRADESGKFVVEQPVISAKPDNHPGECPVTISFLVKFTVSSGSGTIIYRFKASDGRIWPPRQLVFDGPGDKHVNWYWRINQDYKGFQTIEIIEPRNLKEQKARFEVKCTNTANPSPSPSPTTEP